jgi:DNA-binding transcriptional MocR family regulator
VIGITVAWKHIELVRDLALQPTSKLILFALATRADDEGRCWPSIRKLCQDTGLARRTVQLHLGQLATSGAVVREARSGRANGLRLELHVLKHVAESRPEAQEGPPGGQLADEGCIPSTPPAQLMHSPAQDMHPTCAGGAPEVKREEPLKTEEKVRAIVTPVDIRPNGSRTSTSPWWQSQASVMRQGEDLGVPPNPGEDYRHYKDRLFRIWSERRLSAYRPGRKSR